MLAVERIQDELWSNPQERSMYNHILSIILFTPLVGAVVLLFVPGENKNAIRWVANIFALLGFAVSRCRWCPGSGR